MQLEQEYEEKQMVIHEKRDLEGLIATLCDQVHQPRCVYLSAIISEELVSNWQLVKDLISQGTCPCPCPVFQVGHRDFDVEKKLRRDLKRTHALLADAQLLLSTMDSQAPELPNGSREQIERLHCQVRARPAHLSGASAVPKRPLTVFLAT